MSPNPDETEDAAGSDGDVPDRTGPGRAGQDADPDSVGAEGPDPEDGARVKVREISLEEAVNMGIRHHRSGRLPEAEHVYRKVLEAVPDQPDALHFLGIVTHQLGRSEEAIGLIRSAIAAVPDHPDMHNNLGRILKETGQTAEALAVFERAAVLAPDNADVRNNLGTALKSEGRWSEAADAFQHAIRIDPDHPDAHYNLGNVFRRAGKFNEAATCFRRAIDLKPDAAADYQNLSQALWRAGREDEARAAIREWKVYQPDNPIARHLEAAFGMTEEALRASDEFVATHFDSHAASFDEHLEELQYRTPERIAAALARSLGGSGAGKPALGTILDAGCGTGLCGPLLRPMTERLVGVDLSPGMLERAHGRGYDELGVGELTAYLSAHPREYDAVVSADTLVYFGALEAFADAAHAALRPGGWLLFTVESLDAIDPEGEIESGYRLLFHGRYAHRRSYVERVLGSAGLRVIGVDEEALRQEVGQPVVGWLLRARRPESD